jgi:ABC-type antimicrobial peptide transport system permease subunit
VGAGKRQLIGQFIGESLFVSFIAICFSLLIVFLLLPSFNTLTEKHLSIDLTDASIPGYTSWPYAGDGNYFWFLPGIVHVSR